MVEKLLVYPDAMRANLDRLKGLIHSQAVMLALTQAGVSREDAYGAVQAAAMRVWAGEGDFPSQLRAEPAVADHLEGPALEACFDEAAHTRHVDTIFARVFGED